MNPKQELGVGKVHGGLSIARNLLLVCAALVVTLPARAAVRYGRMGVFYGPAFAPWGWYSPFYGPYPYYGGYGVVVHPNAGQLKLDTKVKDAQVFINGALAGTAKDFKSVWLRSGTYNLEVRAPGRATYSAKIYIVNGKTLRLHPDLGTDPKS